EGGSPKASRVRGCPSCAGCHWQALLASAAWACAQHPPGPRRFLSLLRTSPRRGEVDERSELGEGTNHSLPYAQRGGGLGRGPPRAPPASPSRTTRRVVH